MNLEDLGAEIDRGESQPLSLGTILLAAFLVAAVGAAFVYSSLGTTPPSEVAKRVEVAPVAVEIVPPVEISPPPEVVAPAIPREATSTVPDDRLEGRVVATADPAPEPIVQDSSLDSRAPIVSEVRSASAAVVQAHEIPNDDPFAPLDAPAPWAPIVLAGDPPGMGIPIPSPASPQPETVATSVRVAASDPSIVAAGVPVPTSTPSVERALALASNGDDIRSRYPGSARVRRDVNIRAQPGGRVLGVVERGSTVDVGTCDPWCSVHVDGREGWIWRSFLRRSR